MMAKMAVAAYEIKKEISTESICRLCFTERDHYRLIFEDEYSPLAERIENLTTLKIMKVPNAPASLCLECENTLQNFESFREMCFTNDRVIREMFSNADSGNLHSNALDNFSVKNEIKTDQSEELPADSLDQGLDSTIDFQQDNTDITVEYHSDFIIEDVGRLHSNDIDDDKKEENNFISDTEELQKLEKSEPRKKAASIREKRHICNCCDKRFATVSHLKIHIRSHTQERPYKCKDCGKSFTTHSNLKAHMSIHSGVKPFSCGRCEAKYAQASGLIRHKRRLLHSME